MTLCKFITVCVQRGECRKRPTERVVRAWWCVLCEALRAKRSEPQLSGCRDTLTPTLATSSDSLRNTAPLLTCPQGRPRGGAPNPASVLGGWLAPSAKSARFHTRAEPARRSIPQTRTRARVSGAWPWQRRARTLTHSRKSVPWCMS